MSGSAPSDGHERAGLYVLGVLDAAEMAAVRRDAASDAELRAAIVAWERRLAPLAALAGEAAPPAALWDDLVARLDEPVPRGEVVALPARPSAARAIALWRMAALGAMAVAAGLGGLLIWRTQQTPARLAMVMPMQQSLGGWLIELQPDGGIRAIAQGNVRHAADRDFELWALAENATAPVALGLLPAAASADLRPRALPHTKFKLLVSLEPKGGAPGALPTGPVLFAGVVIDPKS